jgi:hypothetical protein
MIGTIELELLAIGLATYYDLHSVLNEDTKCMLYLPETLPHILRDSADQANCHSTSIAANSPKCSSSLRV